jgi:hypothetical protein
MTHPFKSFTVRRLLNSAVAWGFIFVLVRGVGFVIVTGYALRWLPQEDMGLWYLLLNIAGLATIVEFGFTATLGRYASYYCSGAAGVPRLGLTGEAPVSGQPNQQAMAGLLVMARRLYRVFGLGVGLVMILTWLAWVLAHPGLAVGRARMADAFLLAAGSAFNMTGYYWPALLYGANRVRHFHQAMIVGLAASYAITLAGLALGGGMTALVAGQILFGAVPRYISRRLVAPLCVLPPESRVAPLAWRDLWPISWRTGALTLCSYLYIQATTFYCSLTTDLGTTASYGLAVQLALILHQLSAMWVFVKLPEFGMRLARGDKAGIVGLLRTRLALSLAMYAVGAGLLLFILPSVLTWLHSNTAPLPTWQLAAVFGLLWLDLWVGHHSAVLQMGNEAPHLPVFAVTALATVLLVLPFAQRWGVWGVMAAPFLVQVVANYWRTPWLCWRRLGATPPAALQTAG